jgi:hypothetical protein
MMVIHKENIEEYLLLLIDGELSGAEEGEVLAFVDNHPEFQLLLDAFLQTKLEDTTIVFEDKASLLKEEAVVLPIQKRKPFLAIAAAVALLIGLGFVFSVMIKNRKPMETSMASVTTARTITDTTDTTTTKKWVAESRKSEAVKQPRKVHVVKQSLKEKSNIASATASAKVNIEALEPLPTGNYSPAVINEVRTDIAINTARLNPVTIEESKEESRGWAPIKTEKLEVLNVLIAQVETLKDELQAKTKALKITTVAIRLGGKEFTIGK